MKNYKSGVQTLALVSILLITTSLNAQFKQLGNVLSAGQEDAEKIFEAYLTPYASGMGAGLSSGWYNTAKSHKLGGFDLTFSLNVAIIPAADKTYNAQDLNLGDPANGLTVAIDGASSPTAAGGKDPGQQVTYSQNILGTDVPISQFTLPKGTGLSYIPAPMLQLGVGLVKETDIIFRYSPDIEWGNGSKIGLWGVGVKHGLKQWIPALNKLPIFDLSFQGGYTKLRADNALNFQASSYDDIAKSGDIIIDDPVFYSDQKLLLEVGNFTANILVSGDFKVICIYGGVGISSTTSNLKLEGNYPFPEIQPSGQILVTEETALVNPINIKIKSSDGSVTKPRFNAGLRFKFAVITIHFDYTYANYSIASAGLGIALR